jgi:hypothetical protein
VCIHGRNSVSPCQGEHKRVLLCFVLFFFLFLIVLGFELRASWLPGRHSTTSAMPPALLVLVILELGSCFLSRLAWNLLLSTLFCCWTDTSYWLSRGSYKLPAQAGLNQDPTSDFQVARITGVSYRCLATGFFLIIDFTWENNAIKWELQACRNVRMDTEQQKPKIVLVLSHMTSNLSLSLASWNLLL